MAFVNDVDLLELRFLEPAPQRRRRLRLIVTRTEPVERIEDGPLHELLFVERMHAFVIRDRLEPPQKSAEDGDARGDAADAQERRRQLLDDRQQPLPLNPD